MTSTNPPLTWTGPVPVSSRFDDPYYSLEDGLAETRHVFLKGNDLPARLVPGFHVAELGMGTGLNLLALAAEARGKAITYTGFEAYPLTRADLAQALAPWPDLPGAEALIAQWPPEAPVQIGTVTARMILGDARVTLPQWEGRADAWFLDGFAPAKNPELWAPALLAQVAAHTAARGSFATYTAAGHVRRALAAAGFVVERRPASAASAI